MAFPDPQSITIATVTTSLPKTVTNPTSSVFGAPSGALSLDVSQQWTPKLNRSLIRVKSSKISTDPIKDTKSRAEMSAYLVVQRPPVGFTDTEVLDMALGLIAALTATTNDKLKKLIAGES